MRGTRSVPKNEMVLSVLMLLILAAATLAAVWAGVSGAGERPLDLGRGLPWLVLLALVIWIAGRGSIRFIVLVTVVWFCFRRDSGIGLPPIAMVEDALQHPLALVLALPLILGVASFGFFRFAKFLLVTFVVAFISLQTSTHVGSGAPIGILTLGLLLVFLVLIVVELRRLVLVWWGMIKGGGPPDPMGGGTWDVTVNRSTCREPVPNQTRQPEPVPSVGTSGLLSALGVPDFLIVQVERALPHVGDRTLFLGMILIALLVHLKDFVDPVTLSIWLVSGLLWLILLGAFGWVLSEMSERSRNRQ